LTPARRTWQLLQGGLAELGLEPEPTTITLVRSAATPDASTPTRRTSIAARRQRSTT